MAEGARPGVSFPVLGFWGYVPVLRPSRSQKDFSGFTEVLEGNLHEDSGMTLKQRTSQVGKEPLLQMKQRKTRNCPSVRCQEPNKKTFHTSPVIARLCHRLTDSKNATLKLSGRCQLNTQEPGAVFGTAGGKHLMGTDELHSKSHLTLSPLLTVSLFLLLLNTHGVFLVSQALSRESSHVSTLRDRWYCHLIDEETGVR